ncbi:hypothetical protein P8452_06161 [Trifolium repens]|nr:hypothetical protein P8452_06161 [Trifolium repens]
MDSSHRRLSLTHTLIHSRREIVGGSSDADEMTMARMSSCLMSVFLYIDELEIKHNITLHNIYSQGQLFNWHFSLKLVTYLLAGTFLKGTSLRVNTTKDRLLSLRWF